MAFFSVCAILFRDGASSELPLVWDYMNKQNTVL